MSSRARPRTVSPPRHDGRPNLHPRPCCTARRSAQEREPGAVGGHGDLPAVRPITTSGLSAIGASPTLAVALAEFGVAGLRRDGHQDPALAVPGHRAQHQHTRPEQLVDGTGDVNASHSVTGVTAAHSRHPAQKCSASCVELPLISRPRWNGTIRGYRSHLWLYGMAELGYALDDEVPRIFLVGNNSSSLELPGSKGVQLMAPPPDPVKPGSMKDAHLVGTEVLLAAPKRFVRERLRMPDGAEIDWCYSDVPESVMVVPITPSDNVILVKQYRHNLKLDTLELPAGVAKHGEDLPAAALRELQEETGYVADGRHEIQELGRFYALPSETNKWVNFFGRRGVASCGWHHPWNRDRRRTHDGEPPPGAVEGRKAPMSYTARAAILRTVRASIRMSRRSCTGDRARSRVRTSTRLLACSMAMSGGTCCAPVAHRSASRTPVASRANSRATQAMSVLRNSMAAWAVPTSAPTSAAQRMTWPMANT